jgi:hypothetical protein
MIIAISNLSARDFLKLCHRIAQSRLRQPLSAERSYLSAANSATAVECISVLAMGLGPSFDPLVPVPIPTLLCICVRPNTAQTVFISRAKATTELIIDRTRLI